MLQRLVLAAALTAVPLTAQTPPCDAFNDLNLPAFNPITQFGFAGPSVRAYQVTPTTGGLVQALTIYTANGFNGDFMTLEIYDEDPSTNLPGTRLGGGTWRVLDGGNEAWQGTNLDLPVLMLPGTPYWVVWTEPGLSIVPTDPLGFTSAPSATPSGGGWSSGSFERFMCRLYCSPLDGQGVTVTGNPCASSAGVGTVFTQQPPQLGNLSFSIESSGLPSNALCWLVMGLDPTFVSVPLPFGGAQPGCMIHTNGALATLGNRTGSGDVRSASPAGYVRFTRPIPNDPNLQGLFVDAQLAVIDPNPAAAVPIVTTNAIDLILF